MSELKIYGAQSSEIQGLQSDADRFRINFTKFMKEQSGNKTYHISIHVTMGEHMTRNSILINFLINIYLL